MSTSGSRQNHDPADHDEHGRIRRPELLTEFTRLVRRAKSIQHGAVTAGQYRRLRSAFMAARKPISDPLFGWYMSNEIILRRALDQAGITVRVERFPKPHRYRLGGSGIHRLSEIEAKITKSKN